MVYIVEKFILMKVDTVDFLLLQTINYLFQNATEVLKITFQQNMTLIILIGNL